MQTPLTHSQHIRAITRIGLPLVGGHLAQFLIGLTDTVMMGWYGVEALAALVLGTTVFFVTFLLGSGFAFAVMPLVASAAAEGDEIGLRRITRMGLWLSVIYGALFLPMFWFSAPLLEALGQAPELAAEAQVYLRITGVALIPALLVMVIKSYLAALERTAVVFWITVLAAAANALANYMLIFGNWGAPELGVAGAACASLIVHLVSLVGVVIYARATLPAHNLFARLWRPDFDVLARVLRMGVPIGLTNFAEVGLFAASSIMMGWLGTVPLAAHGIVLQIGTAAFMIHLGLSNAATVRAGNAFGQKDRLALRRGAQSVIALSAFFAAITCAIFLIWPEALISLFLSDNDPDRAAIVTIGTGLLVMAALFQLADGMQVLALGLLRGVQDTTVPMIIAGISYWGLGLTTAYLLGFTWGFGGIGVWAGLVIGLAAAGVMMMSRFWLRADRLATSGPASVS
ncbi:MULTISPECIES: MATE family efflux transporter [Marinovum]|jgi:MATE family multidrug resistance protein|uniref:MATE family efflux transporter n=1 Tax=Marinovum TaxID=367771 RepID=UPI00065B28E2|nr:MULTISPECIES: MATE family efflux transporter [Marinovum]AKO95902.1 putative efflux protein, MATE family [Marinovum algicola DG 898]MDD9741109.1 MATE family efflux transporter [Marinovum sp. SP66]MDD9742669.1 MATE family efflux transporter [Marinovum sp. PR37]